VPVNSALPLPVPDLLQAGVQMVARIHHAHGVKATMAVLHLWARFPHWPAAFWSAALDRAQWHTELRVMQPVDAPAADLPPARAKIVLARTVVPYSYAAVRSWAAKEGGGAIAPSYLEQACDDPGYLGHRLSILLAFIASWETYRGTEHELLWLDRLCEYVLACRYDPKAVCPAVAMPDVDAVIAAVLRRPGFFGHHAITLAWILRMRQRLSPAQFGRALAWCARAAETAYADEEDNVEIDAPPGPLHAVAELEAALQDLLSNGKSNIHLLTVADAIAFLWDAAAPLQRGYLLGLARSLTGTAA
jgi:hypothetical protein